MLKSIILAAILSLLSLTAIADEDNQPARGASGGYVEQRSR